MLLSRRAPFVVPPYHPLISSQAIHGFDAYAVTFFLIPSRLIREINVAAKLLSVAARRDVLFSEDCSYG